MRSLFVIVKHFCGCYPDVTGSSVNVSALIDAAAGAGLAYLDFVQPGHLWFQSFPDPARYGLAGGVFQAGDLIQVVVVQLLVDRFKISLQLSEVHDPTSRLRSVVCHRQAHMERVPMQARALVSLWNIWEAVGCFKVKLLVNFHACGLA